MEKMNFLGTEKLSKLLMKFAIPGIIALVVNALYNIVDQIFIGQGVGYLGNGATNVIFPLTTFAMALALMIGDGTASWMSLMLGKKEARKAAQGTAAGLVFVVLTGILIAFIYLVFLEPLCLLFGATPAILPYALQYGRIIALGLPFCAICAGYSSIIRADGSPKFNMIGLLTGCIINLIGDPIFIFVFHMGVSGAALATILGQIANACLNLWYVTHIKSVNLQKDDFKSVLSTISSVAKLGISSFISQMVIVVVIAVQNNFLKTYGVQSEYGADIPISALGVTMKVFNILLVIVIGLSSGAQPIWGYNYGARQYDRVKKTYKLVAIISTCVMLVAFVVFQCAPMAVVSIFGASDPVYNKFAVKTLKIFLLLVPFTGFQLSTGIFFQSVGRPLLASLISLSKQIIFMIPAMIIMCPILGVEGVLWGSPIADALTLILTVTLLFFSWKKIFNSKDFSLYNEENTTVTKDSRKRYFINGKPTVICIGRTYGAGAREIGKKLAQELGIPYYDSDIIKEAAEESGLSAMYLSFVEERSSIATLPSILPAYGSVSPELMKVQRAAEEAENAVIEKVAANGSCVIIGRRADQILKNKTSVFSVFVNRPVQTRIQRIKKLKNVTDDEAQHLIKTVDSGRKQYYNIVNAGQWGNSSNYNLCLDASMGEDRVVSIIKKAVLDF